jgi:pentatricopeptide repeat protein
MTCDEEVWQVLDDLGVARPWKTKDKRPRVTTWTFNFVLKQLKAAATRDAGARAEQILRYMRVRRNVTPDAVTWNTVLAIYSQQATPRNRKAATRANTLLRDWQSLHLQGKVKEDCDIRSFNTVLSAYVRADAMPEAERLWDELTGAQTKNRNDRLQPDAVTYSTLIRGYANQGNISRAEELFQNMKDKGPTPTVESFNQVLYAYSKSSLPGRAEEMLKLWCDDMREPVRPDVRSFNTVLHALSKNSDPSSILRAERLLKRMPVRDATSYTTFVNLCCRLPGHLALDATERALEAATDDTDVTVDAAMVANVLYSLSNCDDYDMPTYAETVVEKFIQSSAQRPTVALYNALLHCWAKSADRDAGRRARAILARMQEEPSLSPDIKTYTNVMDALTKSRDPEALEQAEEMVAQMEKNGPPPTTETYTVLIQNYARSRLSPKAVKAAAVLQRMTAAGRINARPSIVTYNSVLNAAEHTSSSDLHDQEEALKVACLTFDEIRNAAHASPTHVTYGIFLGVLSNLMPVETRQEIVGLVFRRCCLDGQVSYLVLKKLKAAVDTPEHYEHLLMGHNDARLPASWTCHVRESKARNT